LSALVRLEQLDEVSGRIQPRACKLAPAGDHVAAEIDDLPLSACVPALVHAAETEPAVRDFHHAYSARRRQRLTDTIAAGVDTGEFPTDIDPDAASAALAGAMFYRRLMTPDAPDTAFIARLVDTVLGA
jgi:TetR/AcrR family transcriptional regulator, regulator of autoinduction and epiphytic fitness